MRAVIDTNVLIGGLLWHGPPHALLTHVRDGLVSLVSSPVLLTELDDVLSRPKVDAILANAKTSREQALREVRQLAEVIEPTPLRQPVCRDPDDDEVLALALAARADLIVSGDVDLLVLQQFEGIFIVNPAQALERVVANEPQRRSPS